MSKSGFSTLNRWLGRKNKDKSMVNGKLSKSNTNLSISSTNINETSQLEYNRITPLPAATTNAPFEQTFRITVLLPKDQLYVTRLGARVPLRKLLELVCDNKLLDEDKYEFRNPVDSSQVYSCDLTIGAVGLSEIRLCHKSESYDNFNSDEIIKLRRTSMIRESLSSSEFSSRNSKHTMKTTSPYSSTNSLNSIDSSAVSCGRSNKLQSKMSAPPRKKRAAPRPPSQTVIPEKSSLMIIENGVVGVKQKEQKSKALENSLATKDFSISTPNLTSSTLLHSDINGNMEDFNDVSSGNGSLNSHGYSEDTVLYAQVQKKNALNLNSQSNSSKLVLEEINPKFPEPSPRKRIVQIKKKTAAPPAPPPRNSLYQDDVVSIASTNVSCNSAPSTPMDTVAPPLHYVEQHPEVNEEPQKSSNTTPTPVPRITTSTTLLNTTDIEKDLKLIANDSEESKAKSNISKVMLNRTPTPEPRSLSCEPPEIQHCYDTQLEEFKQQTTEEDCVSKQADSGIGEPVPSPIPDSLTPEVSTLDVKSHFESSSDDDDMVKVYNFKLGKTLVKPVSETKTLEELTIMNNVQEETDSELGTPLMLTQVATSNAASETSSWNFAIPISPPPNFADNECIENVNQTTDVKPDTPITPKITERPILNFEDLKQEQEDHRHMKKEIKEIPPSSPLDSIVQELSSIIHEKGGVDSLMRKTEERKKIEAATPNTLSNFSINAIAQTNATKPKEVLSESTPKDIPLTVTDFAKAPSPLSSPSSSVPEEEKLYRKHSSISSLKQRKSVTRSDSFHTTAAPNESTCLNSNKRTSSQLSLDQMAAGSLNCRRSSSELSIGESPSLQSLEIIKTILNSRKNSLANSSGEEENNKVIEVNARRPSEELKFTSLELKAPKSVDRIAKERNCDDDELQIKEDTTKNVVLEDKPKELPKVYRYSGPPSINFSTWSERPKSQVSIKNEGDYIFGGGAKSIKDIKSYRLSTPVVRNDTPFIAPKPAPKPTPKPATIQRMGIPEKVYKVPILVRPLQDVVIDKAPATQKEDVVQSSIDVKPVQRPTVESVLRPQTQFIVNNSTNGVSRNIQRANTGDVVLRPQTQTIINTSTLPRANKQRFSTPATIAGPQLLRSYSQRQQEDSENVNNSNEIILPPGPQILRSSSIKQQETEKFSIPAPSSQPLQAPFGQNTLRRTGFKEKMLAKEEQEMQNVANIQTPAIVTSITTIPNGGLQTLTNQKTSAKLHLNLKQTNTSITTITSQRDFKTNINTTTPTPTSSSSSSSSSTNTSSTTIILKPKPTTPKTAPVLITANTFLSPTSPPPPPPTPSMMIMSIQPKPLRTPPATDDPRDELLTAIRNFNRIDLKKA